MKKTISNRKLKLIVDFSRQQSKKNDFNHNFAHAQLTAKLARYLAKKEGADEDICVASSYLHDIGRSGNTGKHGPAGAKQAEEFLKKIKLPPDVIGAICYAIARHDSGPPKKSREAAVLWDADKLQAIGPFGFLRIFSHHLTYDTKNVPQAIQLTLKKQKFFFQRFHTPTGRKLAKVISDSVNSFHSLWELMHKGKIEVILKKK